MRVPGFIFIKVGRSCKFRSGKRYKVTTVALVDEVLPAAAIAGAANAVRLGPQGQLQADMFDGEGFVRGVQRKGLTLQGKRALVVGTGGVGCAIAASLAAAASMSCVIVKGLAASAVASVAMAESVGGRLKEEVRV